MIMHTGQTLQKYLHRPVQVSLYPKPTYHKMLPLKGCHLVPAENKCIALYIQDPVYTHTLCTLKQVWAHTHTHIHTRVPKYAIDIKIAHSSILRYINHFFIIIITYLRLGVEYDPPLGKKSDTT